MLTHQIKATLALARATLTEALRSKLLWVGVMFAVLLIGLSVAAASVALYERARLIIDVGLAAQSGLGSLIALTAAIGLFAVPLVNRDAYVYLVRPLSRGAYIAGRFAGLAAAMAAVTGCMGCSTAGVVWLFGGSLPFAFWVACGFAVLQVSMVIALTFLFSTLASPAAAAIYSASMVLAGSLSGEILRLVNQHPAGLVAYLLRAAFFILPDFAQLSVTDEAANALPLPPGILWQAPLYAMLHMMTSLCLATVALSRRRVL